MLIKDCPNHSDEELVSLTLTNQDYFYCLVSRYEAKLNRYLGRLGLNSPSDREDVLQNTFLKAYRNLNGFNFDFKFSSWIYRITHNESVSFFRRSKGLRFSLSLSPEDLSQLASSENMEFNFDFKNKFTEFKKALTNLDSKYKDVIILKFLEDKSYEEISDIIKKPTGTVATLISRGRRELKKQLKKYE